MATLPPHNESYPSSINTYFSRPSKVTKSSSSRNQSPRNRGGRRMTTHLPARTRSVVDPQRSSICFRQPAYPRARPMSWHAAFVDDYQQFQSFPTYLEPQQYDMYGNTLVNHGLPTPNSFSTLDEGFSECPSIPLDHLNSQDLNAFQNTFQYASVYNDGAENNPFLFTSATTNMFADDSMGLITAPWSYCAVDPAHNVPTAPVSPDFLPMPDMGNKFNATYIDEVPDKDELVGMGLYDSPADVQSASLLFGGPLPVRRKSLKLEESFEPGPLSDEDEDEDSAQQDDVSVVSAELQTETATTMPSTHISVPPSDAYQDIGPSGFESHEVLGASLSVYPDMSLSVDQQAPRWF